MFSLLNVLINFSVTDELKEKLVGRKKDCGLNCQRWYYLTINKLFIMIGIDSEVEEEKVGGGIAIT